MNAAIEAIDRTQRYGRATVLDHLDLEVAADEELGYLGPIGGGRTTFIRLSGAARR